MESVAAPRRGDINILSNILLSDNRFNSGVTIYDDTPDKENVDFQVNVTKSTISEEPPVLFKNLAFELPNPKRKNSFAEGEAAKRPRTESSNCDCDDFDSEAKVFNYLTGTYESVEQTAKEKLPEDYLEIKEENISIEENPLIKKESEKALDNNSGSFSNSESHAIVSENIVIQDGPIEPQKLEVFDNTISNMSVNGNILEQILKGTSLQSVKSLPPNHNVNGSKSHANLNKSMLCYYLVSDITFPNSQQSLSKQNSENITKPQVLKSTKHNLNEKLNPLDSNQILPLLDSSLLKTLLVTQNNSKKCPFETLRQLSQHKCKSCSYLAKTKSELWVHNLRVHYKYGDKCLDSEPKTLLWREKFGHSNCDVVLKCFDCDTVFDERSQLEMHVCLSSSSTYKSVLDIPHRSIPLEGDQHVRRHTVTDQPGSSSRRQENCKNPSRETSILYKLLMQGKPTSKNSVAEASKIDKTNEILSRNGTTTKNRGTSGKNVVVLSDDEIGDRPTETVVNNVLFGSEFGNNIGNSKNWINSELAPISKATLLSKQEEFNDVTIQLETGQESVLNDATDQIRTMSSGENVVVLSDDEIGDRPIESVVSNILFENEIENDIENSKNWISSELAPISKATLISKQEEFNDVMILESIQLGTGQESVLNDTTDQIITMSNQATIEINENDKMEESNDICQEHNRTVPEVVNCIEENSAISISCLKIQSPAVAGNNDEVVINCCDDVEYSDVNDNDSTTFDNSDTDLSVISAPSLDQPKKVHKQLEENNDQEEIVIHEGVEKSVKNYQCFDCRYSNEGDLPQFKLHVTKHIGSKFRCMPHLDTKEDDCMKCCYENALVDVAKHNVRCLNCGFTTDEVSKLKAHHEENLCDVRCSPGGIKCFHCPYVTSRKKYLYYHAVDHVQESFSCTTHSRKNVDACLRCVYEYCLDMAKKDVLECEFCGFKTVIIALFDVHQCSNSCSALYTCWDCKLDWKTIDELREHAVAHYKSEFRCENHKSAVNNCSQCLYQALANSLEGNVFVCEKCNDFKSLSEDTVRQHTAGGCSIVLTSSELKCFHCDYKTRNKNLLKYHCKEHYDRIFVCKNHLEAPQLDCPQCIYQKLLSSSQKSLFVCTKCDFQTFNGFHFKSHTSKSHPSLPFKCFDCDASFKTSKSLKYHAIRHNDSKFKCTDHNKSNQLPTCQKCIYENIIRIIQEETFTCKKCGFKSHVWTHMKTHESDETNCEAYKAKLKSQGKSVTVKPGEIYSCFDCDFSHERFDFLKAHVKEHRASKFECNEHKTPFAGDCPKCRYVQLLSTAVKERLCCYDCDKRKLFVDVRDLHEHVAEKHPLSNFACNFHTAKKDDSCRKCFYGKIVEDVVASDFVKLICWDCEGKVFSRMTFYEDHIVYTHLGSSQFSCPEHYGKKPKRCSKCLYQKVLQQHTATTPPPKTLTFQCFQCNFSHKQFYLFRQHVVKCHTNVSFICEKHSSNCPVSEYCPQCFYYKLKTEKSIFFHCYECSHKATNRSFSSLRLLKKHIKEEHENCAFVCTLHLNERASNCLECLFEILARDVTRDYRYQCSICSYKCDKIHSFMSHKHEKFKCKVHSLGDCPRCTN